MSSSIYVTMACTVHLDGSKSYKDATKVMDSPDNGIPISNLLYYTHQLRL